MSLGSYQAYPTNYAVLNAADRVADAREYGYAEMGLTIRQRYAMAAMQGMLSDDKTSSTFYNKFEKDCFLYIAATAFKMADEMILFEEQENARGKTATNETGKEGEELGNKTAQRQQ